MKRSVANGIEYVYDVGKIDSVESSEVGCLVLKVNGKTMIVSNKPSFVIIMGYFFIDEVENTSFGSGFNCNDPRIIYLFLWNQWRKSYGKKLGIPEIPTMEEARRWVANAGIPPIPAKKPVEYSNLTKGFLFNGKNDYEIYNETYLNDGRIINSIQNKEIGRWK